MGNQATNPNRTFTKEMHDAGKTVTFCWEMPGPPYTEVVWLACYDVDGSTTLIETFKYGDYMVLTETADQRIERQMRAEKIEASKCQ